MSLLQIYQWVCQRKNFENLLTFGEVMGKSLMFSFFTHSVYGLWGCESRPISFRDDKTWLSFLCSYYIIFADSCLVLLYKVLFLQCCAKILTRK